ncbi:piwi 4 [Pelobates cultripes]|uniref:Piwi 4 n=1 Tax=Pelobates cultripes TaxID=61616 RepID=A0AAD1R7H4_PELCU|nr:piwi 4 [Pelobates cultripes]
MVLTTLLLAGSFLAALASAGGQSGPSPGDSRLSACRLHEAGLSRRGGWAGERGRLRANSARCLGYVLLFSFKMSVSRRGGTACVLTGSGTLESSFAAEVHRNSDRTPSLSTMPTCAHSLGCLLFSGTVSAGDGKFVIAERGRRSGRNLQDMGIFTRQTMAHVKDRKTGTSGIQVKLLTNLFSLGVSNQWCLHQYHVDFDPAFTSRALKTALLYSHEDILGKARAFDGATLFLPRNTVHFYLKKLSSTTKNGELVKITVTLTNKLPPGSPVCIQFFNIILKKILKSLSMYQVGRNYYSPSDPVDIPQHRYSRIITVKQTTSQG